ncbi:MAG: hypothetical protein ACOY5U_07035 [Pseudomonadota bacterium]
MADWRSIARQFAPSARLAVPLDAGLSATMPISVADAVMLAPLGAIPALGLTGAGIAAVLATRGGMGAPGVWAGFFLGPLTAAVALVLRFLRSTRPVAKSGGPADPAQDRP